MADEEEQVHVTTTDARAGNSSKITRYILAISMAAVIVIFAVVLLYAEL